MEWIAAIIGALAVVSGVALGHRLNQRATDKEREHDEKLRREEWERSDARRWDSERVAAYSALWDESLKLTTAVGDLASYWKHNEESPKEAMYAFESQRDTVAAAFARAKLLASRSVRATLVPLWNKTLEVGRILDEPPDTPEAGENRLHQLRTEHGSLLGDFDAAVAQELGIN